MRPLLSTQSLQEPQDLGQLDSISLAAVCRAWLGRHDDILLLMTGDGRITHQAGPQRFDAAAWRGLWSKPSRRPAAAALAEAAAGRSPRFQGAMTTETGEEAWFDVALAPVINDGDHGTIFSLFQLAINPIHIPFWNNIGTCPSLHGPARAHL